MNKCKHAPLSHRNGFCYECPLDSKAQAQRCDGQHGWGVLKVKPLTNDEMATLNPEYSDQGKVAWTGDKRLYAYDSRWQHWTRML